MQKDQSPSGSLTGAGSKCSTDFQRKPSRTIVDGKQVAIVKTLKTGNMMKDCSLARETGNAGWHGFIIKPEYKAAEKVVHQESLDSGLLVQKTVIAAVTESRKNNFINASDDVLTVTRSMSVISRQRSI